MIPADMMACRRDAVESHFQDAVVIGDIDFTADDENNRIPGAFESVYAGLGTLQRMTMGEERAVADRLEGSSGYRLKVPHTVSPVQSGKATVDGVEYEIIAGFGDEARATHTKFFLKRIT